LLVGLHDGAIVDGPVGFTSALAMPAAPRDTATSFKRASSRETICTAISLATSPAACPPMPSATMKTPALRIGVGEEVVLVPLSDHADVRTRTDSDLHQVSAL
jgi:hypothetical protein